MSTMTSENGGEEVVEAAAGKNPKFPLIVILSIMTGVLLMFSIATVIYHVMSGKALQAELAASKDELKRQTQLLNQSQEQVVALSKQMHALREFSVAKANAVAAAVTSEPAVSAPASSPAAPAEAEIAKAKPANSASAPVARKGKAGVQDCQLVGKSQEEQAATLKRCMQSLDGR